MPRPKSIHISKLRFLTILLELHSIILTLNLNNSSQYILIHFVINITYNYFKNIIFITSSLICRFV